MGNEGGNYVILTTKNINMPEQKGYTEGNSDCAPTLRDYAINMGCSGEAPDRRMLPPNKTLPRQITIKSFNHGYLVMVDCQSLVIENKTKLIDLLHRYLINPSVVEKEYNDGTLFQNG